MSTRMTAAPLPRRAPGLPPVAPIDIARLPRWEIEALAAAGETLDEVERVLARSGDNPVGDLLRHQGAFYEWELYPPGGVTDPESGAQFYYHAHDAGRRFDGEHGHFHTFLPSAALPRGSKPPPRLPGATAGDGRFCHLVAVSMDERGRPYRLFTTNRWVTEERWAEAEVLAPLVDLFVVELGRPSWAASRWLTALIHLFRPQVEQLLLARDRTVAAWRKRHPEADPLDDRRLEVTSWIDIDPAAQRAALLEALKQSRRR